jgi:hypothetical protein
MFFGHQPDQLSKVSDPVNPYGWMINPAIAESSTAKGGFSTGSQETFQV